MGQDSFWLRQIRARRNDRQKQTKDTRTSQFRSSKRRYDRIGWSKYWYAMWIAVRTQQQIGIIPLSHRLRRGFRANRIQLIHQPYILAERSSGYTERFYFLFFFFFTGTKFVNDKKGETFAELYRLTRSTGYNVPLTKGKNESSRHLYPILCHYV